MDEISFGTDGWRATLDVFTTPRVRMVGQAVASYLATTDEQRPLAIGYDARETSREFADALAGVLTANGFDVVMPPRDCPTPVVAWNIVERGLAGALMVTASHNPPEYNGVKFIPDDGAPALPDVTDEIVSHLAEPEGLPEADHGTVEEVDFVGSHREQALSLVDGNLSGLTVAYDAMHGSGRGVTDALLEAAGAEVIRLREERDVTFGGTPPEPNAENLQALADYVESGEADLGVANDGDADRIGVVTPERGYLSANHFFAAIYDYLLESDTGPAVRTVSTTYLIDRIAEAHGQEVVETAVGFKWVAQAMQDHDALMGGEESGGFSIRGHVPEKDGVLMALLAAVAESEKSLDQRVTDLLAEHGEIHQSKSSLDCPDSEKARVIAALDGDLPETVAGVSVKNVNATDGFKIVLEDGSWLLVRPSGTEPKLRVYAEAGSTERVGELLDAGRELVEPLV
ncbi:MULTISPECIES: phosphoglucomutase/phosphomannomutase family protein [unclassified Haladaptatus]|uniref:phosphoglucomutase/phosphomannomutase family protein n=1 Tax=unclassified Haladaptatus TaxID=2622732 RepID=UPI0023E8AB98|nr:MULTISPECIES: phosphoglucomutase/phosphomannomutase family protein [unclassified Haladaptatus]